MSNNNSNFHGLNIIHLKYNITDLIDIYFGEGDHIYFFGPKTKRQSLQLVIALTTYPFFCFYVLKNHSDWVFLAGTILFTLICYDYWKVARPIIIWKKSVIRFLKEADDVKLLEFHYNNDYFIHIQDEHESKKDWSIVEYATINDKSIVIRAEKNFLLPKSAMSISEYEALADLLMQKVKNVTRND